MTRELHTRPSARNNLGNRIVPESQVSIPWNCGLVQIMIKKGDDIYGDHDARFVREQLVQYVGNNIGAKIGDEENHFPAR